MRTLLIGLVILFLALVVFRDSEFVLALGHLATAIATLVGHLITSV